MTEPVEEAVSLKIPGFMKSYLRQGLKYVREGHGGKGLAKSTVVAARKGVSTGSWSEAKWMKASGWLSRHQASKTSSKTKDNGDPKPWYVSFLLWGDNGSGRGMKVVKAKAEAIKKSRRKTMEWQLMLEAARGLPVTEATMNVPDGVEIHDYLWDVGQAAKKKAIDFAFDVSGVAPSELPHFGGWATKFTADEVVVGVYQNSEPTRWFKMSFDLNSDGEIEIGEPVEVKPRYKPGSLEFDPVSESENESVNESAGGIDIETAIRLIESPKTDWEKEHGLRLAKECLARNTGKNEGADRLGIAIAKRLSAA